MTHEEYQAQITANLMRLGPVIEAPFVTEKGRIIEYDDRQIILCPRTDGGMTLVTRIQGHDTSCTNFSDRAARCVLQLLAEHYMAMPDPEDESDPARS